MAAMNEQLEAMGENVRIAVVEYYTAWEKVGQTVYFDDRALQMGSHWVPGDPRRGGFYDITWLSDQVDGKPDDVALEDTQAAIDRAMATWDGVTCSTIPLTQLPDYGMDWGYVQWLLGFGGIPGWYADITHYYNDEFPWGINTGWPIDVETVVLHETGHGLSQDHFGKLLRTDKNGKFHFAPRAVMNAGYTDVQQHLTGTDLAGHCSLWGAWPYN